MDRLIYERTRVVALSILAAMIFSSFASPAMAQDEERQNILVIISDDMGIETLASFGVGENTAKTATLDALAERGVSFNNMWAQPV
jgi:arylsulfatase